jgi:aminomethyltransferase
MNGVDYFSAHHCLIESRKSSPFELGLDWTVQLDREPFIGQAALRAELKRGPALRYVGLVCDWDELERLCAAAGLPPQVTVGAWREPIPVFGADGDRQVGKAMCGAWSPTLKKLLALASVDAGLAEPGTRLRIEHTVEYERHSIGAQVTPTPFFDPPRKRS